MNNKKLMIGSFLAGFIFILIGIIFSKNVILFVTFFVLGFVLFIMGASFEKRYTKDIVKKNLDDIANNEEETKELILRHKDDNNVLGFIYDVYNKKYDELNDILTNCPWEIAYDYDEEAKFYLLSINNVVDKKKKDNWYINIYSSSDGDSLVINDYDTSISNLTKEEILALLLKELRKHVLPKSIDFVVRASKGTLYFYIIAFLAFGAGMVTLSIFYALNRLDVYDYIVIMLILSLLVILTVVSIIGCYFVKVELKHDCLTYTNLFGKKKSCMALDIKYINITHTKNNSTMYLYNHNDELIMKINSTLMFNFNFVRELSMMANWYHFKISL